MADESKDRGVASVKEVGIEGKPAKIKAPKEKRVKKPITGNPFSRKRPARSK